jgi:NitT/TauT family transport system permease protein
MNAHCRTCTCSRAFERGAAIPTVLSGSRIGGALVIVGVVVSEMLISSAGIGYLISRYRLIERRAAVWRVATRAGRDAMAPSAVGPAA